jgi:REP element-mobilizing transposase RayT
MWTDWEAYTMRDRWKFYESRYPYFMTCTVVGWLPVFTRPTVVQIIADSWKYLQAKRGVTIYAYVVMENHLHWIAQMPDPGKDAGDFKSFTARTIIDHLIDKREAGLIDQLAYHKDRGKTDRPYQFWQEGSHPVGLETESMVRQKVEYIHDNPVRRGYVNDPAHWRYSSARNFAGHPAIIDIPTRW